MLDLLAAFQQLASLGYLGIFAVSLLSSASVLFPLPGPLIVAAAGLVLNPWFVGIAAGLGGGIGELTGWLVGRAGKAAAARKSAAGKGSRSAAARRGSRNTAAGGRLSSRWLRWAKKWSKKRGLFPVIILFAATPLPMDVIGILSGAIGYDWRKFTLAAIIGKTLLSTALALAANLGAHWLVQALAL